MSRFTPKLETLPDAQRRLWPELAQVPKSFVLYGGTAIVLRLGHRSSLDFDFFASEKFATEELMRQLPLLQGARMLQSAAQTLTVAVHRHGEVKLSFFWGLSIGRVGNPEETEDGTALVASLIDLAGLKAAVVTQRSESKDYVDLLALMETGISLPEAMAAALALYPETYNPILTAKALAYFGDGDLHKLTAAQRTHLSRAAAEVNAVPELKRLSDTIA